MNIVFTRCWCCSQLKKIDLDIRGRLCQDCDDEMAKREERDAKTKRDSIDEEE
jgi:hypothetical protein